MKNFPFRNLVMLLLSLVMLTGCGSLISGQGNTGPNNSAVQQYTKVDKAEDDLYIIAVNDFHYLAPSLNNRSGFMEEVARSGDGKTVHYSDYVVEAFVDQVIYHEPDALLIMGDNTYNGEAQSHIDLAELLHQIQDSGIPVGIIPGNHDVDIPYAYNYSTGEAVPTDSVDYDEFKQIFGPFGYDNAEFKDDSSFSYMMELDDNTWAVFLDCNAKGSRGRVSDQTLDWLVNSLEVAKNRGKTVISATHQNLCVHNEKFTDAYLIENYEVILDIYDYFNVRLNLAGHLHIQHLALDPDGLNELVTGAASVQPNNFAHIIIDPDLNVKYRTESIDVAHWAHKNDINNSELLDFPNYSREFFKSISYRNTTRMFENRKDLTKAEIETLVTFSSEANTDYFAGDLCATCEGLTEDEAYLLWKRKASDMWIYTYMETYLYEPTMNHNIADFSIAPLNP